MSVYTSPHKNTQMHTYPIWNTCICINKNNKYKFWEEKREVGKAKKISSTDLKKKRTYKWGKKGNEILEAKKIKQADF